jgi:hypothetical protein
MQGFVRARTNRTIPLFGRLFSTRLINYGVASCARRLIDYGEEHALHCFSNGVYVKNSLPRVRPDLIVKNLDGELLVYDNATTKAFCLNASSALVWEMCDGNTTIAEMTERLTQTLNAPIDATFVTFALERFRADGLLEAGFRNATQDASLTRAGLVARLGRAGIAAALVVPLVTSIVAPTAAKAYGTSQPPPGGGGGTNGCVLFATPVLRADGHIGRAGDIAAGAELVGVRTDTGAFVPGTVAIVHEHQADGFYTFVTQSGEVVSCSATHPLIRGFGDRDGTKATEFSPGDPLLVHDPRLGRAVESPIVSVAYSNVPQPVYVFEMTTDEHTYFTGGIVSHNYKTVGPNG